MEAAQIKAILSDLGYGMNTLLELKDVNAIVLEGQMNLYPDPETRFMFKSSGNIGLILGYRGKTDSEGNFIANSKPAYAVPFDQLESIQMASKYRPTGAYRFGRSM